MLSGQNIVCMAPNPWDSLWRNRQQLMSRLAHCNTVLYVEPRVLHWRTVVTGLLKGEISPQAWASLSLRHVTDKLYVYNHPYFAPATEIVGLSSLATRLRYEAMRSAMRRLGMSKPIVWLYRPEHESFIGHLGEALVCYHIVDAYSGYTHLPESRRAVLRTMEQSLLARADVVIVTSDELYKSRRAYNPNTYLVRNAVDYQAFAQAAGRPAPADVAELPRPIIGYVGVLNDKLDYALLESVAEVRPAWSIVLVGPVDERSAAAALKAKQLSNVYFLGGKSVAEVPDYVQACDTCILPYQINEWTQHIDALKLYEYLACGKPVISTDIPTAHTYPDTTYIAADTASFVSAIEQALTEESDPGLVERRHAVARENTWDHRVVQIGQILATHLNRLAIVA